MHLNALPANDRRDEDLVLEAVEEDHVEQRHPELRSGVPTTIPCSGRDVTETRLMC